SHMAVARFMASRMTNRARESMGLVYGRRSDLRGTISPDRESLKHQPGPKTDVTGQQRREGFGVATRQPQAGSRPLVLHRLQSLPDQAGTGLEATAGDRIRTVDSHAAACFAIDERRQPRGSPKHA